MKKTRKILVSVIALAVMLTLCFGAVMVKAETPAGTTSNTVYFSDGFFCLHPHLKQQGPYDKVEMVAVPADQYTGYPKATLDMFAAFIMLQMDYYYATGGENGGVVINNNDIQALIWNHVCTEQDHIKVQYHLQRGNQAEAIANKQKRLAYLNYVNAHKDEVVDNYTMTIWVSKDPAFQDLLEVRLVEKHGAPTMEKKVQDKNDTDNTGDAAFGWQDGADYDIGDEVPFQLTATLSDMPSFSSYYLEFVDHMEHLTMVEGSLKVTLDGEDVTDHFTVTKSTSGYATDLKVTCENILPLGAKKNSKIVMTYSATLNEDAVVGNPGNSNEAYLVYTRSSGTADKGTTLPDKVKVFTYRLTANKVDPENEALEGAAFKLSKKLEDGTYQTVAVIGATENADGTYTASEDKVTIFVWNGIDDGTYKLEEVVTPVGYNTMEPIEFWIKAEHDHHAEDPHLYYLNSNYDGFKSFYPPEFWGIMGIEVKDDLTGYVSLEEGDMITNIVNQPGSVLPSTGGMGTKIFYALGTVLVLAAGVLLVTKRRVSAK